jgi:cell division protein FtsI (penicillin-binding protein 3)
MVFGGVLIFGLSIIVSVARLQLGLDSEFNEEFKKRKQNTRTVNVKAIRGNIYADDGSLLATSVPTYDLVFDPKANGLLPAIFNTRLDSLCRMMGAEFTVKGETKAKLLAKNKPDDKVIREFNVAKNTADWKAYFLKIRSGSDRHVILLKDLGFDMVKKIKTWPMVNLGKFKGGFWTEERGKRLYFMGDMARRTIGYTKDSVFVGLEGAFDSLLRGNDGKRMEQRMPGNIWRPIPIGENLEPKNGYDIITTLDVNLQDVAQNALNRVLIENEADHGCAVVMEVSTGAIKALANLKRDKKTGQYYDIQNYAVDEFSEPGSTFKLVSVMAMLEDGLAKPQDSVDVQGGTTIFNGEKMVDATAPNKRFFTLQESFEKSSNVGISKLVVKHYGKKPEKYIEHCTRLGLNIKPDFDIQSSNGPVIKTKKSRDWSPVTLPWMSIGYETMISPLQTLMIYNAIANGGKMMKPYMVKEIRHEGKLIKKIEPNVVNEKICSEQTIATLKSMLEGVVTRGTATNLKSANYSIAGKTGTALIAKGKKYEKGSYKASFAGYFPANNPKYTIVVVINEPRKGEIYGGRVAGPVFKDIADKVYSSSIKLQPTQAGTSGPQVPDYFKGEVTAVRLVLNKLNISSTADSGKLGEWVVGSKRTHSVSLQPMKVTPGTVPDLKGMGLRDAMRLLENQGIEVTSDGYGRIVGQNLPPGTKILNGMKIHLQLQPY